MKRRMIAQAALVMGLTVATLLSRPKEAQAAVDSCGDCVQWWFCMDPTQICAVTCGSSDQGMGCYDEESAPPEANCQYPTYVWLQCYGGAGS